MGRPRRKTGQDARPMRPWRALVGPKKCDSVGSSSEGTTRCRAFGAASAWAGDDPSPLLYTTSCFPAAAGSRGGVGEGISSSAHILTGQLAVEDGAKRGDRWVPRLFSRPGSWSSCCCRPASGWRAADQQRRQRCRSRPSRGFRRAKAGPKRAPPAGNVATSGVSAQKHGELSLPGSHFPQRGSLPPRRRDARSHREPEHILELGVQVRGGLATRGVCPRGRSEVRRAAILLGPRRGRSLEAELSSLLREHSAPVAPAAMMLAHRPFSAEKASRRCSDKPPGPPSNGDRPRFRLWSTREAPRAPATSGFWRPSSRGRTSQSPEPAKREGERENSALTTSEATLRTLRAA